jgi:iron complex transport system ATP-binding protein
MECKTAKCKTVENKILVDTTSEYLPLLKIENLVVKIDSSILVSDVSFSVNTGEIVSIIGSNGAGKSTLIKAISGDVALQSGEILLCGKPLSQWQDNIRAKHIAVLPQMSVLNFPFKVEEVVALSRIPHDTGSTIDNDIVVEAIDMLDIRHLFGRTYTHLSGGERQRVQLARVLAQIWRQQDSAYRLLLLDEPLTSLDLGHQQQLMAIIKQFSQSGVGVVMVLHDMNIASQHSDKIIALNEGKLIAQGEPSAVLTETVIEQLFNAKVHLVKHPETGKTVILT